MDPAQNLISCSLAHGPTFHKIYDIVLTDRQTLVNNLSPVLSAEVKRSSCLLSKRFTLLFTKYSASKCKGKKILLFQFLFPRGKLMKIFLLSIIFFFFTIRNEVYKIHKIQVQIVRKKGKSQLYTDSIKKLHLNLI